MKTLRTFKRSRVQSALGAAGSRKILSDAFERTAGMGVSLSANMAAKKFG